MQTIERNDHQMIWLIGVMERLARYGIIQCSPRTLAADKNDLFLELDSESVRYNLFGSDKEIIALYDSFVEMTAPSTPKSVKRDIGNFVLEYKNNRYTLVKHCLEQQYKSMN